MTSQYKITNYTFYFLVILFSVIVIGYTPFNVFGYDVFGYYMYLPFKFKYQDVTLQHQATLTQIFNTYHPSPTFYQAIKWTTTSNYVMRYPIGLSLLYAPFYFIADVFVSFTSYPADGFSKPYQLSILYGCLFYTIIGLYFLKKILSSFFTDKVAALTLIGIAVGTNYFFHVCFHGQGAMSHNILFTLYVLVLYSTLKWHQSFKLKYIIAIAISCGLAALCRATEIISVLIPLLYSVTNWQSFKNKLRLLLNYKTQLLVFCVLLTGIAFIQFGYWKHVSGKFIINPYGASNAGEGLELLHPHLLEVLISFRKGWLIYTPLMLFTLVGFIHLYKKNKPLFTPIFIYFIISFYIIASWSCWWYGACFGVRALIPSYAMLSIPLGYCVHAVFQSKLKIIYLALFTFFIALNLFQSWQINQGIIDSTNMSRTYYFSTFFQTKKPTIEQKKLLLRGKFDTSNEVFTKDDSLTHILNFTSFINFENAKNKPYLSDSVFYSGKYSYITNALHPVSDSIDVPYNQITNKAYTWLKASVWLYANTLPDSSQANFVVEMIHNNYIFKQKLITLNSNNFKINKWNKIETYYLVPDDLRSKKDKVRVLFYNKSNININVDDLQVQSFEPKINQSVF